MHIGITVYHTGNGSDQLYYPLGHKISGRRLAAKNKEAGCYLHIRMSFDPVIEGNDMENVQVLTFIFVNSFDLNIKHGCRINFHPQRLQKPIRKFLFICLLDFKPGVLECGIIGHFLQFFKLIKVSQPFLANNLGEQSGQTGVAYGNPAPGGDTVCNITNFSRIHLVKIRQSVSAQKISMHGRNPVNGFGTDAGQIGHPYISGAGFIDN